MTHVLSAIWVGPRPPAPPPPTSPTPVPAAPAITGVGHTVYLVGGNSNAPQSLLRWGLITMYFTLTPSGALTLTGQGSVGLLLFQHKPHSPILPTGSLTAALIAAGAGRSLVGINLFDGAIDPAEVAVLFDAGVSPRAWFGENLQTTPAWTAATGTPAATGVDMAGGLFTSHALAVFSGQDTHHMEDGETYSNDGTPPSAINDVLWEPGQSGVYLGAAQSGIVKTIDFGVNWGYIRPHAGLGTTWPAGAVGRAVSFLTSPRTSVPPLFLAGTTSYRAYVTGAIWESRDGAPPDTDSTQVRYFGDGLMGHLTGAGVFRVSTTSGDNWTTRTLPGTTESLESYDFAPSGRLFVFAWETTPAPDQGLIYYSDDNGANWTLSLAGFNLTQPCFIALNRGNSNHICAVYKSTTNTVMAAISTNGGSSYTHRTIDAGTMQVGKASGKAVWIGDRLVVAYDLDDGHVKVKYSDDFGANWTTAYDNDEGTANARVLEFISGGVLGPLFIAIDRTNLPILRSLTQGSSWESLTGG